MKAKENLKYEDSLHVLDGLPPQGENPADGDQGSEQKQAPAAAPPKGKRTGKIRRAVRDFLGGDYLSREWVTGNILFILYLALLAMVYIANTYYTEKKFKAIERTKTELKELRYGYITTKSTLMFQGRQSEISKRALSQGLKEAKIPPYKILYAGDTVTKQQP